MQRTVTVSLRALHHMRSLAPTWRFGVKSGGCAGVEYVLKPTSSTPRPGWSEKDNGDTLETFGGTSIQVCGKSLLFILGTHIDFVHDDLGQQMFTYDNPVAAGGCGCHKSFTPEIMK